MKPRVDCRFVARCIVPTVWLALASGVAAHDIPGRADSLAIQRADEKSRAAHERLLAKAKQGRIDVYFIGDSITRRWGATDYPEYLDYWRQRFHGWNAANFGWGGDTAENVLWRLQNGELDGVCPKMIIAQVGTNNLSKLPITEEMKESLEQAVAAILATCRDKAADASICLFGIFPRNDIQLPISELNEINQRLRRCAIEHNAMFVDINDQLLDENGRLKAGATVDGLHLSLQGYQIWADAISPILERQLGPRSEVDHAPPPTGQ